MWLADLKNGNYRNPVLYADYSDPDAIRVGDDYFYDFTSFCSTWHFRSSLKRSGNWKVVNYVLDKIPEFRYRNPIHGCGVWQAFNPLS